MDLGLRGRVAIVGGASSGLGLAIARGLASEGAHVVMTARSTCRLSAEAEQIGALAVPGDLTDPEHPGVLVSQAADAFGGLDIVVWNTGGPVPSRAAEISAANLELAHGQILLPLVRMVQAALPLLLDSPAGRLLAVTATSVREPAPGVALSNAVRPGLAGYLKTLAGELAPGGITVNCIAPGRISTPRVQQIYPQGVPAQAVGEIPAGRFGAPEEFAAVACFLASARASYVTGTTVTVDGGLSRALA